MSIRNKVSNFKQGMRVLVTRVSNADRSEGIKGDMIGHVERVDDTFVHVKFIRQKGIRSTYDFIHPFFPEQIRQL